MWPWLNEVRSQKSEAVRPRVGDKRKRSDPATTIVARERRPREGTCTKRVRSYFCNLEQCRENVKDAKNITIKKPSLS
ncbi:MAG: hypothetical protein F6K23_30715 [Okeania sp. SIO2C9]|uniref:hypothetical protein n=1 Tax=Okeania sp. SIO2C9 TaxID=2607791 RepID=UPI0013C14FCC|nr:hypothetical protein [Okeania sp. SIO2C9]NEQ77003.1 hypothetical protein [Okeania sp. SIO2C9]